MLQSVIVLSTQLFDNLGEIDISPLILTKDRLNLLTVESGAEFFTLFEGRYLSPDMSLTQTLVLDNSEDRVLSGGALNTNLRVVGVLGVGSC